MRYIRTKDGIVDLEKFINEEKDTPYYKDFIFEEITKDGVLKWTAIGTEKCSIKDQIGRRCCFGGSFNSEIIKQADTIEELCDALVVISLKDSKEYGHLVYPIHYETIGTFMNDKNYIIYGAIWTSKGLIYVAKMNDKGELELL